MNKAYNQQLVRLRNSKELTIKDAAKAIGISKFHLFLLENGYFRPTKKTLEKIEKFYETEIDFSELKEYPGPCPVEVKKKKINKRRRLLVSGIISSVALTLFITGYSLLDTSSNNKTAYYGQTYVEARKAAIQNGKPSRDIATNLEFHYLDYSGTYGNATISFYDTNSILYFNNCAHSCTITDYIEPQYGTGRFHYQFGGDLGKNSYICTFTYGSSSKGLFFSCDANYKNEHITSFSNLNIMVESLYTPTHDDIVYLFNRGIDNVIKAFDIILSENLGRETSFYKDFLPAREQGRVVNFALQITGLVLAIPAIFAFFIAIAFLLLTLVSELKSFLAPLDDEVVKNEKNKPLPKDFNIHFGIPDYIILAASKYTGYIALGLMLLISIGKLFLPIPEFFTSEGFFKFLSICYVASPFINQLIMFGTMKKENTIFGEIVRYTLLYAFMASIETTIIGIANTWGYEIADLIYRYIPGNIFLVVVLNYLVFLFLFFKPKFLENKRAYATVLWRLLSLIPVIAIVATAFIGNSYNLFYGVKKNVYLIFWLSNSNIDLSMIYVLFLYATFFIKFFFKKKYGKRSSIFYNGNRYMLISNLVCTFLVIIVAIMDYGLKGNEYAFYLGIGEDIWILVLIPIVLFCKYGPNTVEISHVDDEIIDAV